MRKMEFGHHLSSHERSGSTRDSSRYQTGRSDLRPKHRRILSTGSLGFNSNQVGTANKKVAEENKVYTAQSWSKKSVSDDLASTVTTDMLTRHSKDQPPYSKAKMAAIYSANQALLKNTSSHSSIHKFDSKSNSVTKWSDFINDTKDRLISAGNYDSRLHLPRNEHQSDGTPEYIKPLAHDRMSQHRSLRPRYHDQRPPLPASQNRKPPDYRIYDTPPQEVRYHIKPKPIRRVRPIRQKHYGSRADLPLYPDVSPPPPPRLPHGQPPQPGGFSQKMPTYHDHPSLYVSQLNTDTRSLSADTLTADDLVIPAASKKIQSYSDTSSLRSKPRRKRGKKNV